MGKAQDVTLEDYVRFLEGSRVQDFSCKQRTQIMAMNGLTKPINFSKRDIMKALRSIPRQPLPRSTIEEHISPVAFLELEVKEDMAVLKWEEYPVQTVETLKTNGDIMLVDDLNSIGAMPVVQGRSSWPQLGFLKEVRSLRSKRRRRQESVETGCSAIIQF